MRMRSTFGGAVLATLAAGAATATETRGLGAHVHGHGTLNIAVEGGTVAMELEAPGTDIVGFEHVAESAEDKAAVEAAKARLSDPLSLFVMPAAAGCTVVAAEVALIGEGGGHDDDAHGHDHDHDHGHGHKDEHAEGHGHDDHGHKDEHAHDDHDKHEHDEAGHTEFRASYEIACTDPASIDRITFAYFEAFAGAEELDIQMITDKGSAGFDVGRGDPVLEIGGQI